MRFIALQSIFMNIRSFTRNWGDIKLVSKTWKKCEELEKKKCIRYFQISYKFRALPIKPIMFQRGMPSVVRPNVIKSFLNILNYDLPFSPHFQSIRIFCYPVQLPLQVPCLVKWTIPFPNCYCSYSDNVHLTLRRRSSSSSSYRPRSWWCWLLPFVSISLLWAFVIGSAV